MSDASPVHQDWSRWLTARQLALAEEVRHRLGPGTPLPPSTRSAFEGRLGHDLGAAVLHPATIGRQLADALGAEAFSVGSHVVVDSPPVERNPVLGHELAHVVHNARPSGVSEIQRESEEVAQRVEEDVAATPAQGGSGAIDCAALAERVYRRMVDEIRRGRELGSAWS
jgi:hypothetical protein